MHKVVFGVWWAAGIMGAIWLASEAPSRAAGEGPYLNAGIGAAFMEDFDVTFPDAAGTIKTDPGERFTLGVGYTLYSSSAFQAAVQFETGVIHNSIHSLTYFDYEAPADGDVYQVPFLADLVYTFPVGRLVPYIGFGGGGVYRRTQLDNLDGLPFGETVSETDGAVQGMAGLRFRLNDHNELGAVYKYLATFPQQDSFVGTHSISLVYILKF
ncbi:MAG TPA: outer membrane beta-barrel protein [Verrucomicrobiae bacterium]|nr:outer membrane beta-barrel protein [Verrucomicrobiae bacterium]